MIAGMRGFLEGKPDLIPAGIDLSGAEDGYQAVELLGRSAGLSPETIAAGHLASRADLAASAWAVDESDGLADLIAAIDGPAFLGVLVEPADPAAAAVLDSTGQEIELVEQATEEFKARSIGECRMPRLMNGPSVSIHGTGEARTKK